MKQNVNRLHPRESERHTTAHRKLPREERPPRIVVVDDESGVLESMGVLVRSVFPDAILLMFSNSAEAWKELSQRDPDLLLIDDLMPGLRGKEIVRRLVHKKTTYPIIVHSAYHSTDEGAKEFVSQGLNIQFVQMPFDIKDYQKLLQSILPPATH